jgi:hypothetical protein
MTPAALLISLAGLSQREASEFLKVRLDTVKSWSRANKPALASPGILAELRALIAKQDRAAREALKIIRARKPAPDEIEIGYPADDYEAKSLGWPCIGAWAGMAARVVAEIDVPVILSPRGSTAATAAAIDAHHKKISS